MVEHHYSRERGGRDALVERRLVRQSRMPPGFKGRGP